MTRIMYRVELRVLRKQCGGTALPCDLYTCRGRTRCLLGFSSLNVPYTYCQVIYAWSGDILPDGSPVVYGLRVLYFRATDLITLMADPYNSAVVQMK